MSEIRATIYYDPVAGFLLREYSSNAAHPLPPKSLWSVGVGVYILCMVQFDLLPPPPPLRQIKNNFPLILQSKCLFSCSLQDGCSLWASSPIWASKVSPTTKREQAAKPRGELAHRLWWLQTSRLSIFKEKCGSLRESGWRGIAYEN